VVPSEQFTPAVLAAPGQLFIGAELVSLDELEELEEDEVDGELEDDEVDGELEDELDD